LVADPKTRFWQKTILANPLSNLLGIWTGQLHLNKSLFFKLVIDIFLAAI
jgi:hypothetical protein